MDKMNKVFVIALATMACINISMAAPDPETLRQLQQIQRLQSSQQLPSVQTQKPVAQPNDDYMAEQLRRLQTLQQQMIGAAEQKPAKASQLPALDKFGRPYTAQTRQGVPLAPAAAFPGVVKAKAPIDQKIPLQEVVYARDSGVRDSAFRDVVDQMLPMSPEEIQKLRLLFNATQFASESPAGSPPRPTAISQQVSLAPGVTPPVIRLAQGFVTSLVLVDSTGAPWPIVSYNLGNPDAFNIQWDRSSNTLMVQASKLYTYGNLAVRLEGLNTPVMLTLIPGQKAVDYRVELRIQGQGPNALPIAEGSGLPDIANPELLSVLDGVPPEGSTELVVGGGNAQAWAQGNKIFVRTRMSILSPSWIATMKSADGMRVYELQKTPLLLVSHNGKVKQLKIEGL